MKGSGTHWSRNVLTCFLMLVMWIERHMLCEKCVRHDAMYAWNHICLSVTVYTCMYSTLLRVLFTYFSCMYDSN